MKGRLFFGVALLMLMSLVLVASAHNNVYRNNHGFEMTRGGQE